MKKIIALLGTIVLFFNLHSLAFAAEETPTIPYFGIGATVQEKLEGEYVVKTEGRKEQEGFVYTPPKSFSKENIKFQITIKGKGTVLLKLEETSARGQYLKEKTMEVELTEDWATYEMTYTLESPSSQIDASVITKSKENTEFTFKNLQIIEE
ncbi:carbohydrate binding domain-containing protein [Lysinibacillus sp. SGAir0095]|uniref:carbohydrate binding domain-containing protein n=1 Tax=Lysinibacillus sp. SGAir0095 TaxID=2070463 RepID=UPI0010CCBBB3|nr:carbohydrate binding domain-containing protein [Lysinibacillus sp. SGAir0095]QCR32384.1 hypothetical protein C1N55_09435 [Lysinibacillus sp. SGAir0095]